MCYGLAVLLLVYVLLIVCCILLELGSGHLVHGATSCQDALLLVRPSGYLYIYIYIYIYVYTHIMYTH